MELGHERSGLLMDTNKQVNGWQSSEEMMIRDQVVGLRLAARASGWPRDSEEEEDDEQRQRMATVGGLSQGSSFSAASWQPAACRGLNSHAAADHKERTAHEEPGEERRQVAGCGSGDRCAANEDNRAAKRRPSHSISSAMESRDQTSGQVTTNSAHESDDRGHKFARLMDNEQTSARQTLRQPQHQTHLQSISSPAATTTPTTTTTSADLTSEPSTTKGTQSPDSRSGASPMSSGEVSTSSIGMLHQSGKSDERQLDRGPAQRIYPPNHPLSNTKHLCSICGDKATGKHYGVYSCEGCKGFFKRTIRKDIVYVCRNEGHCLIDMRQRNRCQYCRYQKCLRQGMKREAVQEEKQRLRLRAAQAQAQMSGHQMDSRVESSTNSSPGAQFNPLISAYGQDNVSSINSMNLNQISAHQAHYLTNQSQELEEMQLASNQSTNFADQMDCSPASSSTPSSTPVPGVYQTSTNQQPASYRHPVMRDFSSFYNSANQQQVAAQNELPVYSSASKLARIDELTLRWAAQVQIEQLVDWARGVPHFRSLLLDDQVTLLRAYWNELIIADIAFKSVDTMKSENHYGRRSLFIGRGLFINECQADEIGLGNMFGRIIDELVIKMRDLRVDANELACLRAIILFNPETQGLKSSHPIEVCRSEVYTTLESYCRENYCDQPNRFGKLLLRLPALRSIGLKCDPSRRCDSNQITNNNLMQTPNSNTNSLQATGVFMNGSQEQNNMTIGQHQANGIGSPNISSPNILGYQYKLLFYDICYQSTPIDSFLRSNLTR